MYPAHAAQLVQWLVLYATGRYVDEFGMLADGDRFRTAYVHVHGVSARARDWLNGASELYVSVDTTHSRSGDHTKPYARLLPDGEMNDPEWQWTLATIKTFNDTKLAAVSA